MAGISSEEAGVARSTEGISSGQRCQSGEALAEWRSSEQVENGTPSTSPPYWDTDDDDDGGPKPSELYGKYTWKIEKFSQINKRELRSNAFEVGGYKWYILIYPQGCDVCNHLSLFLCVANHDKLLPGWSHFAQFTIAVVNKDPKKSKYSDTLHRFWKKEHDWGWKKFMELSKVSDGFLDASDTLIIKAQVQVIREKADRPFRCLDCQYRRELVRVYLTNVEQICRRFVEERRGKLGRLIEDKNRWSSFCAFWLGMDPNARRRMSRERTDVILKVVVKHFFIEKEVTSTLVMDSLYSGLKALEGQTKSKKGRVKLLDTEEMPAPIVRVEKDMFVLVDDVLLLLERAAMEPLPPKDEKGPQNRTKDGNSGEDFNKDSIERDERRLTELGRRTVEIFVLAHIFNHKIEVAYQEAVALKRQEELIREEEAAWLAESEQKAKRGGTEKEKKSKKKQAKQKRNNRKGRDKGRDERSSAAVLDKHQEENPSNEKKGPIIVEVQPVINKPDILEDLSDVSDSVDGAAEVLQLDSEDRDASPVNWDTDTSEVHPPAEASGSGVSGLSSIPNGSAEKRSTCAMDDSSSTCSTDSVPSVVNNGFVRGNSHSSYRGVKSPSRVKHPRDKVTSEGSWTSEMDNHLSAPPVDAGDVNEVTGSSKAVECELEAVVHVSQGSIMLTEPHVVKKVVEEVMPQKKLSTKDLCAGVGYLFGSISPVIKSSLNYNQRQLASLGVAKDLGDSVGFLAGSLSEILPLWGALLVGALQNLVGYGWVWLVVTGRSPVLPLWAMCILIFVGNNGETYFNTVSLVSCVQNFPKSRGPVVGILKGFAGLSGAILTQIYTMIHSPNHASLIFMVAVGPAMVVIALMFIVRPVGGHRQIRTSDGSSFTFIYSVCLLLAAYLMGIMLLEDLLDLSHTVIIIFTVVLFVLILLPIVIPISLSLLQEPRDPAEETLLPEPQKQDAGKSEPCVPEVIFSELEDEKPKEVDMLPASERQKRIAQLQAKLFQAAAEGAVRVRRRRGPHRGEDFTLMQALIKADFWLIFFSLLLGSGSGLTVIDNLGQMSQSLGYDNTHIFVSMISIWNFLGRVGGGYFSEIIVRDYAYPRPVAMAIAQLVMAVGHVFFAFGWPGAMYIGTLLIGLGYGAHWAIVPAAASELFGLKKFGALYNFLTLANPAGSLVFSGLIASSIYDREAERQAHEHYHQKWNAGSAFPGFRMDEPLKCEGAVCYFLTSMIMSGFCIIAVVLSMILVHRTKIVYANLYGKSRT